MPDNTQTDRDQLAGLFNLRARLVARQVIEDFFNAAEKNNVKILKAMLAQWPDAVNWTAEKTGNKVIAETGSCLKAETLQLLLDHGANINDQGDALHPGMSGLKVAALMAYPPQVEMLLLHGAKVDLPDHNGMTPLMFAARLGNRVCADLLALAGADPGRKNDEGESAFDLAKNEDMRDIIRAAQKRRADFLAASSPRL